MAQSGDGGTVFEVGLVLAGAVSAGAYTGGVIDFLLEALEQWESRRGQPGVPPHRVRIKVISGTSAGAMTATILASSLRTGVNPVRSLAPPAATDNKLYDSWVNQADIFPMLRNDDLDAAPRVQSLLNSKAVDAIADSAFGVRYAGRPWPAYVADPLDVYLCTTNLRGVPYSIQMIGAEGQGYGMSMQADYMRFALSDSGSCPSDALPIEFRGGGNWDALKTAALASGAFPVGLSARVLRRKAEQYNQRPWYIPAPEQVDGVPVVVERETRIDPSWPDRVSRNPGAYEYQYANVDGGVINNEPLEVARRALAGPGGRNDREPDKATRAVLMVDPFPNVVSLNPDYDAGAQIPILRALMGLASAVLYQMRFKVEELELARDEGVFSRFVISPVRWVSTTGKLEDAKRAEFALASGALGGFGGFLSRGFRHHDYLLGRLNCQRFLQEHFVLDASNHVFDGWDPEEKKKASRKQTFTTRRSGREETQSIDAIPIIPLLGTAKEPAIPGGPLALVWPRGEGPDGDKLQQALMHRLCGLVDHFLSPAEISSGLLRRYLRLAWNVYRGIKWVLRDSPVQPALDAIKQELEKRGLE